MDPLGLDDDPVRELPRGANGRSSYHFDTSYGRAKKYAFRCVFVGRLILFPDVCVVIRTLPSCEFLTYGFHMYFDTIFLCLCHACQTSSELRLHKRCVSPYPYTRVTRVSFYKVTPH